MKVIKGIVHQPYEVKGSSIFYAFSYYFDRANETGLIGKRAHSTDSPSTLLILILFYNYLSVFVDGRGGTVQVRDFKKKAKEGTL